ncbi:hypothetical protein OG618_05835 [Kitasatospora sp. NBC_01246]|uniref:hypothetical protein n=1 Tax=Kitasatospora sp. NBC_01246 TaxID=2903570 RepID=UPI002E2F796D|nr:hypothetical protein [Kitasatospora sp. NBC_01246]
MNDTDLAQTWNQPEARPEEAVDHPAGDIRLRAGGGLGLRSQLLSAAGGSVSPAFEFPTMTVPI